jgi:aminoglycoside phosphotransferase (APT) family kinase protein
VDRTPAFLAALASAAVPGLDPVSVEALPSTPDQSFDVAFVQDAEHRRWVVRAPRTDVAGAEMDRTVSLLGLLGRRLPFAVPAPKGFVALSEGGRAAVYPYLPGHNLDYAELPAGPGIAAELGRAIAALHNTDPAVYEEAGLPSYDADAYRSRRLADLDRAAETGRVPTTLLTRWETALEDVSLWRFAPTATHGDLTGDQVLAVFTDDDDASTGKVRAVTGWEDAKVADPADDFAALVADAPPEAVETVLEAYSHTRVERPDANLLVRARLVAELGLLTSMMVALARKDAGAVEVLTTQLRRLDDAVHASEEPDDYRRTSLAPVGVRRRTAQPPALVVDDDDDEDLPQVDTEPTVADAATEEATVEVDLRELDLGGPDAAQPDAGEPSAGDEDATVGVATVERRNPDDREVPAWLELEHAEDDQPTAHAATDARDAPDAGDVATEAHDAADSDHSGDEADEADEVTNEIDLRSGERRPAPE